MHKETHLPLKGRYDSPTGYFHGLDRPLVKRDHVEVCSLSCEVIFKLLSEPLQSDIRFFHTPLPAIPTTSLALSLPAFQKAILRAYRVPHVWHEWVRPYQSADDTMSTYLQQLHRYPVAYHFGSSPVSIWLVNNYDGSSSSRMLALPFSLAPHPTDTAGIHDPSHERTAPHNRGLHCQGASHQIVTNPALPLGYRWLNIESAHP